MPFTLNVDADLRIIEIVYYAAVTDKDILDVETKLRSLPAFTEGFGILNDLSCVIDFFVTGPGLYTLAIRTEDFTNLSALVVPPGFIQGMALTYREMVNWKIKRVQVFANRASALEWLRGMGVMSGQSIEDSKRS